MSVTTPRVRTQKASDLVHLDTYTREDRLIFSKADGEKAYVGRVYRASPLVGGGSEFSNVIVNVIKAMPDDAVIQVSLLCEPDHVAAATFGRNKNRGSAVISELIARQQRVFNDALAIGWRDDLPALNVRHVLISPAVPVGRITADVMEDAKQLHTEFLGNIKSCGFNDATALSASELIGVYRQFADIFTPAEAVSLDELVDLRYQVFGPDQSFDFRDPRIGVFSADEHKTYCAAVTCKAYPPRVNHGLMNLVCGAPFNQGPTRDGGGQRIATPFILTTTLRVADQRKEATRVQKAIDSRHQKKTLPFKLGDEDPAEKLIDLQTIQKQCANEANKYVYASTTMFLFGKTRDQVIKASSAVKGTLDKLGFDGRHVAGNGIVRWAQTLPLNFSRKLAEELASEAVMSATAAGCLLPVYGDYVGNAGATSEFSGAAFVTRRGSVHYFDPFRSDSNYCGVIAALGGSGKSVLVQYLIKTQLAQGVRVFALDNGKSLKKFCRAVGGEFNDFGGAGGFKPSLNPFTGLTDDEFDEQQETITALLLAMAYKGDEEIGAGARIALNEAVRAAWGQRQSDAEIDDVIEALKVTQAAGAENTVKNEVVLAAGNLVPRLSAFLDSPARGQYFRGQGTLDPQQQFTVFELGTLEGDDHLKKCVLFFVLNLLLTRIKTIRGRKLIMVDESHDLFEDPSAAGVMEGIYRKARKEGVSAWIVVQSLQKLVSIPAGSVILNQSAWKIVLAQVPEEIDKVLDQKVISAFNSDPYFGKLLRSVETRKGEFSEMLIFGLKTYELVRLYVDKVTGALFSTEDKDRDPVFDLMDKGVPALEAVKTVLGDSKAARATWLKSVIEQLRGHDGLNRQEILAEIGEVLE